MSKTVLSEALSMPSPQRSQRCPRFLENLENTINYNDHLHPRRHSRVGWRTRATAKSKCRCSERGYNARRPHRSPSQPPRFDITLDTRYVPSPDFFLRFSLFFSLSTSIPAPYGKSSPAFRSRFTNLIFAENDEETWCLLPCLLSFIYMLRAWVRWDMRNYFEPRGKSIVEKCWLKKLSRCWGYAIRWELQWLSAILITLKVRMNEAALLQFFVQALESSLSYFFIN